MYHSITLCISNDERKVSYICSAATLEDPSTDSSTIHLTLALISNQGHMMPRGETGPRCLVVSSEETLLESSIHDMTVGPLAAVEIKHPHLIST